MTQVESEGGALAGSEAAEVAPTPEESGEKKVDDDSPEGEEGSH